MSETEKKCFVIMPFGEEGTAEYERNLKIYQQIIKPVAEECDYEVKRADELEHLGNITHDIIEWLHASSLVIADLSGRNANVFYELGVRHALFRAGTIPIIRKGEIPPFDIAPYRTIFYSIELDGPEKLKKDLKQRILGFERSQGNRCDNPVHEVLADKIDQVDEVQQQLQTLQSAKAALQNKLDAADSHQQKLQQEIETRNREKADIQKQFAELKRKMQALEKIQAEYQALQKENKQLQASLAQHKRAEKNIDQLTKEIAKYEKQIAALEKELQELTQTLDAPSPKATTKTATPTTKPRFRSQPTELSEDDVKKMLKAHDFFDSSKNEKGRGFDNQFELMTLKGEKVIFDQASGLMWQQGGSSESMTYKKAKEYISQLKRDRFAGFDDWRLPTLEEAMSLMEPEKMNGDLYIDPKFDKTQRWIWTADLFKGESWAWCVFFSLGLCDDSRFYGSPYVRALRSGQSSGGH